MFLSTRRSLWCVRHCFPYGLEAALESLRGKISIQTQEIDGSPSNVWTRKSFDIQQKSPVYNMVCPAFVCDLISLPMLIDTSTVSHTFDFSGYCPAFFSSDLSLPAIHSYHFNRSVSRGPRGPKSCKRTSGPSDPGFYIPTCSLHTFLRFSL